MQRTHRPLALIGLALVAAFGLSALPAHAGSRGHAGFSISLGYGGHGNYGYVSYGNRGYYGRHGFRHAPPYVHHRGYRRPYGHVYYPRYRHHGRPYYRGHRGYYRGHRGYRGHGYCGPRWR